MGSLRLYAMVEICNRCNLRVMLAESFIQLDKEREAYLITVAMTRLTTVHTAAIILSRSS